MEQEKKYVNIATKVKPQSYSEFKLWCDQHGTTIYDQIQLLVEGFLAYTASQYNLSDEMLQLKQYFESQIGWREVFNLCDHQTQPEVKEAIYFIGSDDKKGVRPMLVQAPFMGQWTQTQNVQQVFERVLENCFNSLYHQLRRIGADMDSQSAIETLQKLIAEHTQHMCEDDLDCLFADNERSEWGRTMADGPYKRKLNRRAWLEKEKADKADAERRQQAITFDDDGHLISRFEDDEPPVKPHGGEW